MKEVIYTIPVMDGFQSGDECPFCAMYRKLNDESVDFVLSPSYMEVDVRGETNELGFCQDHMKQLYDQGNALGLALILHSHMKHRMDQLEDAVKAQQELTARGRKKAKEEHPLQDLREKWQHSCYICSRIAQTFDRYADTFFYMWKKQPEFRQIVQGGKGYCLDHYLMLAEKAPQYMKGAELEEFTGMLHEQEKAQLERVADDVEWFTLKYDYRYKNEPWKNSKDAIPRSILKVNSQYVEKKDREEKKSQ